MNLDVEKLAPPEYDRLAKILLEEGRPHLFALGLALATPEGEKMAGTLIRISTERIVKATLPRFVQTLGPAQ